MKTTARAEDTELLRWAFSQWLCGRVALSRAPAAPGLGGASPSQPSPALAYLLTGGRAPWVRINFLGILTSCPRPPSGVCDLVSSGITGGGHRDFVYIQLVWHVLKVTRSTCYDRKKQKEKHRGPELSNHVMNDTHALQSRSFVLANVQLSGSHQNRNIWSP